MHNKEFPLTASCLLLLRIAGDWNSFFSGAHSVSEWCQLGIPGIRLIVHYLFVHVWRVLLFTWLQPNKYFITWCYSLLLMQTPDPQDLTQFWLLVSPCHDVKSSLCQEGLFFCYTVALKSRDSMEIPVAHGCFISVCVKYPAVPFKTGLFSIWII